MNPTRPEGGTLEPPDGDGAPVGMRLSGLRTHSYKYIEYDTGEREYYDLAADPDELRNRFAVQDPGFVAQLSQTLAALARACRRNLRQRRVRVCLCAGTGRDRLPRRRRKRVEPPTWCGSRAKIARAPSHAGRTREPARFHWPARRHPWRALSGAAYAIVDGTADYGSVESGASAGCQTPADDCYEMRVDDPAVRPAAHWDATYEEHLTTGTIAVHTLHIGRSSARPFPEPTFSIDSSRPSFILASPADAAWTSIAPARRSPAHRWPSFF